MTKDRTPPEPATAESQAARVYRIMTESLPASLFSSPSDDWLERGIELLAREANSRAASGAELREDLTEIKARLEEMTASKAEPEATTPPPKPGQTSSAPPPTPRQAYQAEQTTTQNRAESMERILAALCELDPGLDPMAMPGRKVDFQTMCKELAPRWFTVKPEVFKDTALKNRARFVQGARETTYYRDRLEAVRRKLG